MFSRIAQKWFKIDLESIQDWLDEHKNLLIRVIVILGLAGYLFLLPRYAIGKHRIPQMIIFATLGIGGLAVLISQPVLATLLIIPATLIVPFGIGTGTQSNLNAGILMVLACAGLWVLEMIVVHKKISIIRSRPFLPLFLLMVSSVISLGFGQLPWFNMPHASMASQIGGMIMYILAGVTFLVAAHRLSLPSLKWAVVLFLGLGSIYLFLRPLTNRYYSLVYPVVSLFEQGATGSMFWIWILNISVGQLIFNHRMPLLLKIGLGGMLLTFFYNSLVLGREWTSGWLPPLLGASAIIFVGFRRTRILIGVFALIAIIATFPSLQSTVMGGNEYSLVTRTEAWEILLKVVQVNPIFGVGPANYYFYTPIFPIRGYYVQFNSHNNYMDLLVQTGIVGLGLFIWFMTEQSILGLRMMTKVPEGFAKGLVYGIFGGTIGTIVAGMFGDWVIPFVYNVGFNGFRASILGWFFMGGLVALEQTFQSQEGK
ncbi:O-antigen ligase family protein [Anaerolinea sp.]|uniref:O-antigen ligase family protein n=1 Tax=Anaerolinea sp. TaxID=1872519 RepID=UPI002ACD8749|nr:O-antigen ligase family protein [Anaerolinea sp.]